MQPIGNDGTGSNVVGNAAKNAIIMSIRRCLGRRNLVGGVSRAMYCTTDGGGSAASSMRTLDVAAQITSCSGRDGRGGLTVAAALCDVYMYLGTSIRHEE